MVPSKESGSGLKIFSMPHPYSQLAGLKGLQKRAQHHTRGAQLVPQPHLLLQVEHLERRQERDGPQHTWARARGSSPRLQQAGLVLGHHGSPLSWKAALPDQNGHSLWASHISEIWESHQGLSSSLEGRMTSSEFFRFWSSLYF